MIVKTFVKTFFSTDDVNEYLEYWLNNGYNYIDLKVVYTVSGTIAYTVIISKI